MAWLHDTVEDHNDLVCEKKLFNWGFSLDVVDAVLAITKFSFESLGEYWARCSKNDIARKVKIADSLANISQSDTNLRRVDKYSKSLQFMIEQEKIILDAKHL